MGLSCYWTLREGAWNREGWNVTYDQALLDAESGRHKRHIAAETMPSIKLERKT